MPLRIPKNEEAVYRWFVETGMVEIDEQGRCWRVATYSTAGDGRVIPRERRRAEVNVGGYLLVQAWIDGTLVRAMAHRLVWLHRHGTIPDDMTVNHKNFQPNDNRLENLELLSNGDNIRHAFEGGRFPSNKGSDHPHAKLTEDDVREIRRRAAAGETYRSIDRDFEMSIGTTSGIMTGKGWRHVR